MFGGIQFGFEHIGTYVVEKNISLEFTVFIDDGENVAPRVRDGVEKFAETVIDADGIEIIFNQVVDFQKSKHRLVIVVGEKFSPFCDSFGVDGVWLKDAGDSKGN